MNTTGTPTRQAILRAACRVFAHRGYAAASVQEIVDAAHVTKPVLYYYFASKARLYQALVDQAQDERYRLMEEAARRGSTCTGKLFRIVAALFEFSQRHPDLLRLAFASAFAAPGEVPREVTRLNHSRRNYAFVRALVAQGQADGELDAGRGSDELAFGLYGQMNTYLMARVLVRKQRLNERTARQVFDLFLQGAASRGRPPTRCRPQARRRSTTHELT